MEILCPCTTTDTLITRFSTVQVLLLIPAGQGNAHMTSLRSMATVKAAAALRRAR